MVVSPRYLEENGISADDPRLEEQRRAGRTLVYLVVQGRAVGAIGLSDLIRPESREAVDRLRAMGYRRLMLTGDSQDVASTVARELDLDGFYAQVLPEDKAKVIKGLQREGHTVAMVGDGINDAPALAQADVGIAIGAGTDVAIESADVILVHDDPRDVSSLLSLSRRTYSKMVQNLAYATGYNAVAIPVAAGLLYGWGIVLTPAAGAVLMSVSTVVVAINARLLR